ncbi:GNAT family N-acetyltransferase [Yoonia sp.]|uniref:GNAT family N-acetyltransferase n=1 Tax=Yoonia sp. TaxID=2212373 RepID=UPI0019DA5421|nr:GNAT family N-acetyltransferase [Yoonia sp.]MBE0414590.1 GNAT family N-acetyltransferase [Yoonia sp.]
MKNAPCLPLQQHPDFGAALARLGTPFDYVNLPGAAPVLRIRRFGVNFSARGPIWDCATSPDAQIDALRCAKITLLNDESTCPATLHRAGFRQVMTPAHVAELDLTGTAAGRIARMHGKWRNTWRKAQKSPLRVDIARFDPVRHGWLLAADLAQQRAKRYRALPHAILHSYRAANPDGAVVLTARAERQPVAAMLFLLHAPVATYHIGWNGHTGRSHAAHHLLLMQAADHFAARGVIRLDLGTVDTETAPGLARFKIGSGAQVRPLGGTWLRLPGYNRH